MTRSLVVPATAAVALGFGVEAVGQEPTTGELFSFVWTSGLDGRAGIGDRVANVDRSFDDLIDFVDVGASVQYRSASDPLGWFLEGTYVRLSDTVDDVPAIARAEITRRLGEIGITRMFAPKLTAYLGLRAQDLDSELRLADGQVFDADASIVDGIVGLRWTPVQSATWGAWLRGDIGAGESDSVWLAEVGGGYHFGSRWTAYLAYRLMSTDYAEDDFLYDVEESGVAFGFGLSF